MILNEMKNRREQSAARDEICLSVVSVFVSTPAKPSGFAGRGGAAERVRGDLNEMRNRREQSAARNDVVPKAGLEPARP